MSINNLVQSFNELSAKLSAKIEKNESVAAVQELDKNISEILERIREYEPNSFQELKAKLKFFIDELHLEHGRKCTSFALNSITDILEKDFSFRLMKPLHSVEDIHSNSVDERERKINNAYNLVTQSTQRLSIIDLKFRYLNTSQTNGLFYQTKPKDVVGKHVGELIGQRRFENRAKRFFEKCFSGIRQEYFHTLEAEDDVRLMQCQMLPLRGSGGAVFGSIVAMNDITDLVTKNDSIVLASLSD